MRCAAPLLLLALLTDTPAASDLLARNNACMSCHSISAGKAPSVGPSFRDVAVRYAKDAGAAGRLTERIRKGSSGIWGKAVMPPNPQVTDADRATLTAWILSLAPPSRGP